MVYIFIYIIHIIIIIITLIFCLFEYTACAARAAQRSTADRDRVDTGTAENDEFNKVHYVHLYINKNKGGKKKCKTLIEVSIMLDILSIPL